MKTFKELALVDIIYEVCTNYEAKQGPKVINNVINKLSLKSDKIRINEYPNDIERIKKDIIKIRELYFDYLNYTQHEK